MFFNDWFGLMRVVVIGALAYTALVAMLRVSGNRTLSKMSAFDLVVTVALGSTLATTLLSKDVALLEGLLALGVLIGMQWVAAWLTTRSGRWRRLIKSDAVLMAYQGEICHAALRQERVTEGDIHAALRSEGLSSLAETLAIVLETDGTVTILPRRNETHSATALRDVRAPGGSTVEPSP